MSFPYDGKPFVPGTSGNPNGRPRGRSLSATLRDHLDEEARIKDRRPGHGITNRDLLIERLCNEAIKTADVSLMRLIFDRHDGKAPEGDDSPDDAGSTIPPDDARRILGATTSGDGPSEATLA